MIATARRLTAIQWRYLLESVLLLPLVNLSLIGRGFNKTRKTLNRISNWIARNNGVHIESVVSDIALGVSIASRRLPGNTSCLRQALLAEFFLRRLNLPCELHFGVHKSDSGVLEAHAWITQNGQVIVGATASLSQYAALTTAQSRIS